MARSYRRAILYPTLNAGLWTVIRGARGTLADGLYARSSLVSGTYNPVYYAGKASATNPIGLTNWDNARCGSYGPSTMQSESEGTNLTFSTNGQVIQNTIFYRRISVTGANITFINCIFLGTPTDATAAVTCGSTAFNTTFVDCTICPMSPQYNTACVRVGKGGGMFLRCDIYGGTDGISNNSTSGWDNEWKVVQTAIHDLVYMSPDPDAAGGLPDNASHIDCIQWEGGLLSIDGSALWGFLDMVRYEARQPVLNFGTGWSTTSNTTPPVAHGYGNKYTDTVANPGDSVTPPAVVGAPSIYSTSCVMFSPFKHPLIKFSLQRSFLDGTTWALNIGNPDLTYASGAIFDVGYNKIGTNHRWNLQGTHKMITAKVAYQSSMNLHDNVDLATGTPITAFSDLVSNG